MKLKLSTIILVLCLAALVGYAKCLEAFHASDCGKTKSCLLWNSCNFDDCPFGASWKMVKKNSKDYLEFELVGQLRSDSHGYVSVGFSDDVKMGKDGVVGCYNFNSSLGIEKCQNYDLTNWFMNSSIVDNDFLLTNESGYGIEFVANGKNSVLRCRFARVMEPVKSANLLKDLTKKSGSIYMMWAVGIMDSWRGFGYHYNDRRATYENKVQFYSDQHILVRIQSVPGVPTMVKAHACLMLCGWIFLITNGIFLSAFYKPNWSYIEILEKTVWYQVHIILNIIGLLCVVAAFIIIFVHVNGYSKFNNTVDSVHPIIGIISTALLLINPLLSICRCGPNHPKRPIFNWMHRSIGIVSYFLALITVIIGFQMQTASNKLAKSLYPWILPTIFLGLVIVLYIYGRIRERSLKRTSSYDMKRKETEDKGGNLGETVNATATRPMGMEIVIASVILSISFTVVLMAIVLTH